MDRGPHPAYGHLVRTYAEPKLVQVIEPPRMAVVTTDLYDGTTVTLELPVVARTKGFVCVSQERHGTTPWNAWIPSARARPI